MPIAAGFATGIVSGIASGATIPQKTVFPVASGLVAQVLARKVTTFQTNVVASIATAVGGFFSYFGPQQVPTTLGQVLARVAATIAAAGIVAPASAFVSLDLESFPTAGGPLAVIAPGDFAARGSHQDGLGRNLATEDGTFTIHVAAQSDRDQGGRDQARLLGSPTTSGPNLLATVHAVKDLLNGQFVQDAGGNLLTIEPLFFRGQSRPRRYADTPSWAGVDLTFSLNYVALMTNTATTLMGGD